MVAPAVGTLIMLALALGLATCAHIALLLEAQHQVSPPPPPQQQHHKNIGTLQPREAAAAPKYNPECSHRSGVCPDAHSGRTLQTQCVEISSTTAGKTRSPAAGWLSRLPPRIYTIVSSCNESAQPKVKPLVALKTDDPRKAISNVQNICPSGFAGPRCDRDMDGCEDAPNCGVGAYCVDVAAPGTGFGCHCVEGYTGPITRNATTSCVRVAVRHRLQTPATGVSCTTCAVGEYCSVTNGGGSSGSCMACPSSSDDGVCGCTDVLADNVNPAATVLDTSCEYQALCDESDWTCYPASVPAACAASCSPSDFEPQTTRQYLGSGSHVFRYASFSALSYAGHGAAIYAASAVEHIIVWFATFTGNAVTTVRAANHNVFSPEMKDPCSLLN